MAGKAISIELSARQQVRLQRQLEIGHYENLNEVFDDALRLMNERDAVCEWLREEMRASLADKHPSSPMDEVFKRERAKAHRMAKAVRRGA
jgi:Arc/MetJ-type ribon-helix-helix transcriptional regulator